MKFSIDKGEKTEGVWENETFKLDGQVLDISLIEAGTNRFHVLNKGVSQLVTLLEIDRNTKKIVLSINGRRVELEGEDRFATLLESMGMSAMASTKLSQIKAPMPGLVIDILVKPGQEVAEGDKLFILEAMKMENVIKSPVSGTVAEIQVEKSASVEKNDVLLKFS